MALNGRLDQPAALGQAPNQSLDRAGGPLPATCLLLLLLCQGWQLPQPLDPIGHHLQISIPAAQPLSQPLAEHVNLLRRFVPIAAAAS